MSYLVDVSGLPDEDLQNTSDATLEPEGSPRDPITEWLRSIRLEGNEIVDARGAYASIPARFTAIETALDNALTAADLDLGTAAAADLGTGLTDVPTGQQIVDAIAALPEIVSNDSDKVPVTTDVDEEFTTIDVSKLSTRGDRQAWDGTADVTITPGTKTLALMPTATLSTGRTVTLPLASAYEANDEITFEDWLGQVGPTKAITFTITSPDVLIGGLLNTFGSQKIPFGTTRFRTNGVDSWSIVNPSIVTDLTSNSDATTPTTKAVNTALALLATKASPTFSGAAVFGGSVTVPDRTAGDNTTNAANTKFVHGEVAAIPDLASSDTAIASFSTTAGVTTLDVSKLGARYARLTSDATAINANTTLANITGLVVALDANSTYVFEMVLLFQSSTAADLKLGFTVPSGATGSWGPGGVLGGVYVAGSFAIASSATLDGQGVSTSLIARPFGIVITGVASGSLQFQAAQVTSDATNTVIRSSTALIARKVA